MEATSTTLPDLPENICPACGATVSNHGSEGDCTNPKACIATTANREHRCTLRYIGLAIQKGLDPSKVLLAALESLDVLGIGWLACSRSGIVKAFNSTARRLLERKDGLQVDSTGVLVATEPKNCSIQRMVRRATTPSRKTSESAEISATLVRRLKNKRPLTVFMRSVQRTTATGRPAARLALLLIVDPERAVDVSPAELNQLYRLTPAEARLTKALVNGRSLQKSCSDLNITRLTGRCHLDNIFAKTGVRRQSELISLVLKSIGLARVDNKKPSN